MKPKTRWPSILFSALLCAILPLSAQPTGSTDPAGDGPEIRRSLDRIGRALESLVAMERTHLLFQQVVLEERRLSPLKSDLRSARSSVRGYEDEIARIESYRKQIEGQLQEMVRSGAEPLKPMRNELMQLEEAKRLEEDQKAASERRVMELENDLGRARRSLDILDEKLTAVLEELVP